MTFAAAGCEPESGMKGITAATTTRTPMAATRIRTDRPAHRARRRRVLHHAGDTGEPLPIGAVPRVQLKSGVATSESRARSRVFGLPTATSSGTRTMRSACRATILPKSWSWTAATASTPNRLASTRS